MRLTHPADVAYPVRLRQAFGRLLGQSAVTDAEASNHRRRLLAPGPGGGLRSARLAEPLRHSPPPARK